MKNYYVMTLFPDMIMNAVNTSITGRAIEDGKIHVEAVDIRSFTKGAARTCGRCTLRRWCRDADAGAAHL